MINTAGFIITAAFILLFAGVTLVVAPSIQLHSEPFEPGLKPYTEQELAGRKVYIQNGCVYCHTQQPRDPAFGSDTKRNWGRASTPGDYAFDTPHLLGTMRTGPDLFNIGARQPSEDWHLMNLYQPRSVLPNSIMPSFPYLFELKDKAEPNDKVVNLPQAFNTTGKIIVAKSEAMQLVAYLKSLNHTYAPVQRPFKEKITVK